MSFCSVFMVGCPFHHQTLFTGCTKSIFHSTNTGQNLTYFLLSFPNPLADILSVFCGNFTRKNVSLTQYLVGEQIVGWYWYRKGDILYTLRSKMFLEPSHIDQRWETGRSNTNSKAKSGYSEHVSSERMMPSERPGWKKEWSRCKWSKLFRTAEIDNYKGRGNNQRYKND